MIIMTVQSRTPVKTVERALELSKDFSSQEEKVIYFSAGEYSVNSLNLTDEYKNTVFYADDEVIFNGGVTLNLSDFSDYKDNIKMLDLKAYGVTQEQIGQIRAFGAYNTDEKYDESGSLYCELFCDGERMTLSRYPNEGEENLRTGRIIDNGDSKEIYTSSGTQQNPDWQDMKNPRGGTFAVDKEVLNRINGWKNSDDIWLFGYFQYDWADSTTPLASFDDGSVTTEYASVYGFKEDMPYYFFNVFEELDTVGEWYIDKENSVLYFIPPEDFENKSLELSLETDDLIILDNAENIIFDGITFCGTRAGAIKGTGSNITVENCTIKNVGENAIEIEGNKILVENNTITATGKAGVVLTGGDRENLVSSENMVTNNLIYDWSQVYQTYQAAVALAHAKTPNEGLWATLKEFDVNLDVWKKSYPQLSDLSDDFDNTDDPAFAANPVNSVVENNVVVNRKKNIGNIERRVEKYSTVQNNVLYTFKNNPFGDDGNYGKDISTEGFEPLPVSEMGRTYY